MEKVEAKSGFQESTVSIPVRFAQVVRQHPRRIAIRTAGSQWTYAELDQRSDALAARILERLGQNPEPVALLLAHDAPLMAAIIAVLKAGKIYLVLDPAHPVERLAAVLADSHAGLLISDKANRELANSLKFPVSQIMEAGADDGGPSTPVDFPAVSPGAGAWLMYTSGSTGKSKGVWQNHQGVVHHADVYRDLIQLVPDDHLSLLTSCSLSTSGSAIFGALLNGATLCPFHVRSQGVERMADWLREQRVSVYHSVPTVFRRLAQSVPDKKFFEGLRLVRLGGEPVVRGDVEWFQKLCPDGCRFMNSLSSTETGLISAFLMDKGTARLNGRVPVGHAPAGVEILLLDPQDQPVAIGGEGRIAVRSAHLRQGYWRQPGATAEKFRPDPHDRRSQIFISNDLGRFLPGGVLEHLGRADAMVKISGLRVDLTEVEAALLATELAQEAVVIAWDEESGDKRLAAYVVPRTGMDVSPQRLKSELRANLPEHMIPPHFVLLEKLPQTAGGKIDRRALPRVPVPAKKVLDRSQEPKNTMERMLARIWESVLQISPIGRSDDFYELGGTSLHSVQVLLEIEELLNVSLPPWTLTEHSTIEKLAVSLGDRTFIQSTSPVVPLRSEAKGRPVFFIHTGQGNVLAYSQLTRRLSPRPVYGLQSVGMHGECWPLMSVPAIARRYIPEILAKDPTGPYQIAGACMGGLIALELASLLAGQNRPVGLVALIDTPHPIRRWRMPGWKEKIYCPLRDNFRDAARILRWFVLRATGLANGQRRLTEYRRFVANMNSTASRFYEPKFYPGKIALLHCSEQKMLGEDWRLLMRQHAKDSIVTVIPGKHSEMFARPTVDELARHLDALMVP